MGDTPKVTGIVLAGGRSTRFGSDKASALLLGRPLLQWTVDALACVADEVVVVAANGQNLPGFTCARPARIVRDLYLERGPLAGIVTGLSASANPLCLVLACDMPAARAEVLAALLAAIEGFDAACPEIQGDLQPLFAVYRRDSCLPAFREALESGRSAVRAGLDRVRMRTVDGAELRRHDAALLSFRGSNTRAELSRLEQDLAGQRYP